MQLQFEHTQSLGAGQQPQAIHTPENRVMVLFVSGGQIHAIEAETPFGEWAERDFSDPDLACHDTDVQYMKLKYLAGTNIWVVWRNMADPEEDNDETHPGGMYQSPGDERQRIAVFTTFLNVSDMLITGSLEFNQDNPIAQMVLELKNPYQFVSSEDDSIIAPGSSIGLYFRAGDSPRYPLGRYYVDHGKMSVTGGTVSAEGRNMIGKKLKDQSFDENFEYAYDNLKTVLEQILQNADIEEGRSEIYPSANSVGMRFPRNMDMLSGILELLKTATWWTIRERMDGKIILGPHWWSEFEQPDTYDFQRGSDCWSREITRDDEEAFSRVCVFFPDYVSREFIVDAWYDIPFPGRYVYEPVESRFNLPAKKTLYVQVANGTDESRMEDYAGELAEMLSNVGVIETFVGPIRPHLQPGDGARIFDGGSKLLGVITTVRHMFGEQGFATEFVCDSGGVVGRSRISDYIEKISGKKVVQSDVVRLYGGE